MADVKIVDIDTEQWNIKDQNARDRISVLETKIDGYKTIRYDIDQQPPQQTNNIWSYLMNQIEATDWSFIAKNVCAYGQFIIAGIAWGSYKAIRFSDNTLILSGIFAYDSKPNIYGAVYDSTKNEWSFNINGESLLYLQNNILITYKMNKINNGFEKTSELFVRNIAQTTIGNLYAALATNSLLNRVSTGITVWDLQRQHNGADLPKGRLGNPAYASTQEFDFSGRFYFSNFRISPKDTQNSSWVFNWNDGSSYCEANMFGEPDVGVIQTVSMSFTV